LDQRSQDPAGQEGRFLHRADREEGPCHARRAGRNAAGHRAHVSLAEIDALGRAFSESGLAVLVRPLHAITATFGLETEEPDIVKFAVDGIEAGQTTFGHRFMAPAPINVRRFEDYEAKLLDAKVVLDPERRKDTILEDAKELAFAQGFELVEDPNLLDEV